jgi:hypothetical protein
MRCTEFDGDGKVTLVNGAFKKSELIAKVPLHINHVPDCQLTIMPGSVAFFLATFEKSIPLPCHIFSYALRLSL